MFRDLSRITSCAIFSIKRGEYREKATQTITSRLAEDGIVAKEVLLRKVELPQEYARGLVGLLEKEQEDDRTSVDAQIEQKKVKIAESQAEAAKVRQVKHAEADAQSRVLMAKAESDPMRVHAAAQAEADRAIAPRSRSPQEATIKNAEADAAAQVNSAEAAGQAKVIGTKADTERSRLLGIAERSGSEKCRGRGAGQNNRFESRASSTAICLPTRKRTTFA